jgi:spore cortex formation protein SpoVR/YcgB (stage V sporulation)
MTATAARLFEGAEWDFAKLQRIHDRVRGDCAIRIGARHLPEPDRVITAEQMLDAYSSAGMPLLLQALVVRQALCASRGILPQRAHGPCI